MSEKSAKRSMRNYVRDGASEAENRRNIAEANLRRQRSLNVLIPLTNSVNIASRQAEESKANGQSEAARRINPARPTHY